METVNANETAPRRTLPRHEVSQQPDNHPAPRRNHGFRTQPSHSGRTSTRKEKPPGSNLSSAKPHETLGGGTVASPAVGPAPSYGIGGPGMVLVKNWHFGTDGTIKNYDDMSANFFYHDQFNTIGNGKNYGAETVAPSKATAIHDDPLNIDQPIEGVDSPPVREFTADSLKTYLTPLHGATTVDPNLHNAGCGSFMAQWKLPHGGALLGHDIVWETRVRYVTPPYFWFAIWIAGNKWNWTNGPQGAEQDVIESFGYDNGGGNTNYDGRYWHSNSVAVPGKDTIDYGSWGQAMAKQGIPSYDASQYHIWTWLYKKDDTYAMYCDGKLGSERLRLRLDVRQPRRSGAN